MTVRNAGQAGRRGGRERSEEGLRPAVRRREQRTRPRAAASTRTFRSVAGAFEGPLAIAIARNKHLKDPQDCPLNILVPVAGTDVSRRAAEVAIADRPRLQWRRHRALCREQNSGATTARAARAGRNRPSSRTSSRSPTATISSIKTAVAADVAPERAIVERGAPQPPRSDRHGREPPRRRHAQFRRHRRSRARERGRLDPVRLATKRLRAPMRPRPALPLRRPGRTCCWSGSAPAARGRRRRGCRASRRAPSASARRRGRRHRSRSARRRP